MFYRFALVLFVVAAFGANVWRYPVVSAMVNGDVATEVRYLCDDLPKSSPRMMSLLQGWGEKIGALVKKKPSDDDSTNASGNDDKTSSPAPADGAKKSVKSSDNSLLPPLPQGDMPIPNSASTWGSVSDASPAAPVESSGSHSLAESDATPLLASRFVEPSPPTIPPPVTAPPSSDAPPPLVVAPPAPLAGGVWMPPAL
ncbi:MAG: hypothetical protein ACRC46_10255 [Thermoguttaceae bacterium]